MILCEERHILASSAVLKHCGDLFIAFERMLISVEASEGVSGSSRVSVCELITSFVKCDDSATGGRHFDGKGRGVVGMILSLLLKKRKMFSVEGQCFVTAANVERGDHETNIEADLAKGVVVNIKTTILIVLLV